MKRRFEFRLERVRRVRELEERVARAERARAEDLARAAEKSRDQARSVIERSRAHLREILRGSIDPAAVQHAHRVLDGALQRLRSRVESARTLRTQAERSAAAHRERRSAARALDELRERSRSRHRDQLQRAENALLDEAAQRRAAAARPSPGNPEGDSRRLAGPTDQPGTP